MIEPLHRRPPGARRDSPPAPLASEGGDRSLHVSVSSPSSLARRGPGGGVFAFLSLVAISACATLDQESPIGQNLPSSGVGPFQVLSQMQVEPADVAPYVFLWPGQSPMEPCALPQSTDTTTPALFMYLDGQGSKGTVIARTRADDGISFYGDTVDEANHSSHKPPVVLSPSLAWEGMNVSGPSVMRQGSAIWMYYAGDGGIGLAKSSDGLTFTKTGSPVLAPDASAS